MDTTRALVSRIELTILFKTNWLTQFIMTTICPTMWWFDKTDRYRMDNSSHPIKYIECTRMILTSLTLNRFTIKNASRRTTWNKKHDFGPIKIQHNCMIATYVFRHKKCVQAYGCILPSREVASSWIHIIKHSLNVRRLSIRQTSQFILITLSKTHFNIFVMFKNTDYPIQNTITPVFHILTLILAISPMNNHAQDMQNNYTRYMCVDVYWGRHQRLLNNTAIHQSRIDNASKLCIYRLLNNNEFETCLDERQPSLISALIVRPQHLHHIMFSMPYYAKAHKIAWFKHTCW